MQLPAQGPSNRAAEREPLVQVADDHARARQVGVQDVLAHEPLHLIGALAHLQTEVHVEDVQQLVGHRQVEPDPAPGLPLGPRQIEGVAAVDGKTGEHGVAVGDGRPVMGRAHGHVHAEALGQRVGLGVKDFLEPDEVGVDLLQHGGDPIELHAPIQAAPLVDVVAGHGEDHVL